MCFGLCPYQHNGTYTRNVYPATPTKKPAQILRFAESKNEPLSRKILGKAAQNAVGKGTGPSNLPKPILASFCHASKNGRKKARKSLKLLGFSQRHLFWCSLMEQDTGVEPASAAWEAAVLPMYESCVEFPHIIASFRQKSNRFLANNRRAFPKGPADGVQQSFAPAGMASSSMRRCSFSSPFSLWTAEMSMPQDSRPIIFLGGRLTIAASVLPTSCSGS